MVITGKDDDFIPASHGAGESHRCLDGFRSGADEAGAFIAGHFAEELGRLHRDALIGSHFESLVQLLLNRFREKFRRMSEKPGAKAVQDIDVFIAVDIEKA